MTTRVTVEVPATATFEVEIELQQSSRGVNDDGVRRYIVKAGEITTVYIFDAVSVKSIREIPLGITSVVRPLNKRVN